MAAIKHWPIGAGRRGFAASPSACVMADSSKDLLQRWKDEVGFPHGEIEDILNLSDPPWHTACPEPLPGRVRGSLRQARRSRRAVPPQAVCGRRQRRQDPSRLPGARLSHQGAALWRSCPPSSTTPSPAIWFWTGFAGTGMTGVAAQWCGTAPETYRKELEALWTKEGFGKPKLGPSAHDPERSLAARWFHRCQLRPAFRSRRVRRGRSRAARRSRGGARLDV